MTIAVAKAAVAKLKKNNAQQLTVKKQLSITLDSFVMRLFNTTVIADAIELKYYNRFIKPFIGSMNIVEIRSVHIEKIFQFLSQQAPLSSFKIVYDLLFELFTHAISKRRIRVNPLLSINLSYNYENEYTRFLKEKIAEIYDVIQIVFKDEPLTKSFFLFLFNGKKRDDILNLRWELINFNANTYRIRSNRPNSHFLQPAIKKELFKIRKQHGLIYHNDIDIENPILSIEEQSFKINRYIPDFNIDSFEYIIEELHERQAFDTNILVNNSVQENIQTRNINQLQRSRPKTIKAKKNIGNIN
jgi:integrase